MIAVVFRGKIVADEHRQLVKHALARETAAATRILIKHIQDCVAHTLERGAIQS
jgi:DNA-binding GntR family transcriptional regulator